MLINLTAVLWQSTAISVKCSYEWLKRNLLVYSSSENGFLNKEIHLTEARDCANFSQAQKLMTVVINGIQSMRITPVYY